MVIIPLSASQTCGTYFVVCLYHCAQMDMFLSTTILFKEDAMSRFTIIAQGAFEPSLKAFICCYIGPGARN
jgi:hypothetical protein